MRLDLPNTSRTIILIVSHTMVREIARKSLPPVTNVLDLKYCMKSRYRTYLEFQHLKHLNLKYLNQAHEVTTYKLNGLLYVSQQKSAHKVQNSSAVLLPHSFMITFTPLSGAARNPQTSPLCYLLQVDDVRILLDCGSPDWEPENLRDGQSGPWEEYCQSLRE